MEKDKNSKSPEPSRIPVLEEELLVGKRTVETGSVKARIEVHEVEELVQQPLAKERVEVQRVAIEMVPQTQREILRKEEAVVERIQATGEVPKDDPVERARDRG